MSQSLHTNITNSYINAHLPLALQVEDEKENNPSLSNIIVQENIDTNNFLNGLSLPARYRIDDIGGIWKDIASDSSLEPKWINISLAPIYIESLYINILDGTEYVKLACLQLAKKENGLLVEKKYQCLV